VRGAFASRPPARVADSGSVHPSTPRSARPLVLALLIAFVLAGVPGRALATDRSVGPGEIRRRIENLDAAIGRAEAQMAEGSVASNRGTWLLFTARRAVELARLALRDARLWGTAPDELRLALAGPTPQEQTLANAVARYRALSSSRRVGDAVRLADTLRTRMVELQLARARQAELLSRIDRPTAPLTLGEAPAPIRWARALLAEIGAPACEENRVLLVAWQAQESTGARFNPLATTHPMQGATDFNSVGVKNYLSPSQGLDAVRETLEQGDASYGYASILSSLRACSDAEATAWYVNASAWCRGCTEGTYLTALLHVVRADYLVYARR
jgi:hypothetical protein